MSSSAGQKKDDEKGKTLFTFANVVSTTSILISLFNLFVTFNKEFPSFHFRQFQTPVGLTYSTVEVLPNERWDVLTVDNTSEETLHNVVVSIANAINGSEMRYELGSLGPHDPRVLLLDETGKATPRLPRLPYQMDPGDAVFVTCDGYWLHEFPVKDLGKKELSNLPHVVPTLEEITAGDVRGKDGAEVACRVRAQAVVPTDDGPVLTDQPPGTVAVLLSLDARTVQLPRGTEVTEGDTLVVQGTLRIVSHPPDPTNPYLDGYTEYRVYAKDARRLSLPPGR